VSLIRVDEGWRREVRWRSVQKGSFVVFKIQIDFGVASLLSLSLTGLPGQWSSGWQCNHHDHHGYQHHHNHAHHEPWPTYLFEKGHCILLIVQGPIVVSGFVIWILFNPNPPMTQKWKGFSGHKFSWWDNASNQDWEVCTFLGCSPIQGSRSCTFYCQMQILFIWKQNLWLTQLSLLSGPLLTWKAQIWPENVLYLDQLWLIRPIFWANSDPQHACFGSNFTYKVAWPVLPTSAFIHCK